jgi:uncharacterized protein (TIGR03083 family)
MTMTMVHAEPADHARLEREAFEQAAAWFRVVVDRVERWDGPGLGEWTVRDLVGHTSRSLVTVESYLDAEPGEVTLASPVAYYEAVLDAPAAALGDVTERGRVAGRNLGPDPVAFLADLEERTRAKVAAAPDDAFVGTPFGGARLLDYLPTRTFELVVHTCDLARALGAPMDPPPIAAAQTLEIVAELALADGIAGPLLLVATGRAMPSGFSVL